MHEHSETGDFLQFLIGGCLFGAGGFLLANQVMVRSSWSRAGGGLFGGGFAMPWGTPGMGLLMLPLGIGVCMLFAGRYRRWANLLIWSSLAALFVGVLNSVRITFRPTTLWQLGVYIVMIAAGGGLMFRGMRSMDHEGRSFQSTQADTGRGDAELRREIAELKAQLDRQNHQ